MKYAPRIRTARLQLVADELVGGSLAVLSDGRKLLASLPIEFAQVNGDELIIAGELKARAIARGRPSVAEMRDASGVVVVGDLRVGGEVKIDALAIVEGQTVRVLSARITHG